MMPNIQTQLNAALADHGDNFAEAVKFKIATAGEKYNSKTDRNCGIKARAKRLTHADVSIQRLTVPQLVDIYYHDYWTALNCDMLPYDVAIVVFDDAVTRSVSEAELLLNKIVGDGGVNDYISKNGESALLLELLTCRHHRYTTMFNSLSKNQVLANQRHLVGLQAHLEQLRHMRRENRARVNLLIHSLGKQTKFGPRSARVALSNTITISEATELLHWAVRNGMLINANVDDQFLVYSA